MGLILQLWLLSGVCLAAHTCSLDLSPLGLNQEIQAEGASKAELKEKLIRLCAEKAAAGEKAQGLLRASLLRARCARIVAKAKCGG